jgi:hypothetical protein
MERARKRINRGIRFFPVGLWVVCFSAFAVIDDPIIHIFLLNRPEISSL